MKKERYAKIELLKEWHYRPWLQKLWCFVTWEELPNYWYYVIDVPTSVFRWDDKCYWISKDNLQQWIWELQNFYPDVIFNI